MFLPGVLCEMIYAGWHLKVFPLVIYPPSKCIWITSHGG